MGKSLMSKNQPSLTEWFANIGHQTESDELRKEDNEKSDRLETLYQIIGLPYERPEKMTARELTKRSPRFEKILAERGNELCAIRLIPTKPGIPKLRSRGLSIRECYETWYLKQNINPDDYLAHICPHIGSLDWSIIFVVTSNLVFGEIIRGLHIQLTRGNTTEELLQFRYDYKDWQLSNENPEAVRQIERFLSLLKVPEYKKQQRLQNTLSAKFYHNYLAGYYEGVVWPGDKPYFIDYNRVLAKYISAPPPLLAKKSKLKTAVLLNGSPASPGLANGRVYIVSPKEITTVTFPKGGVLVCDNTDVRYLPLMLRASAIVTDRGSMLCHAAIVSRELKKPCIVATKEATKKLHNGQQITVDASQGIVS